MRPLLVVLDEELGDAITICVAALGGVQINVFVFKCAPKSLDEDAEVTGHGVGHSPGEHLSRVPMHDRREIEKNHF